MNENAEALALIKANLAYAVTGDEANLDLGAIEKRIKEATKEMENYMASYRNTGGDKTRYLECIQKVADEINGVRFVNTTAEVADSLATYRNGVLYALLIALGVIGAILAFSMRRRFIDFWAPTALSIALTFGLCGFAGIPLSLFSVLPLVLVVGIGVDYAIVLYSEDNAVAARNSVFLAASSTLLAFGLLALSSTPALHIFGLTLLLAMASVLVTTVVLRPRD